jgi:plasmid stabilization system protein ParE
VRRTVKFLEEATAEYWDAVAWYADRSLALADRFITAVRGAADRISQWPGRGGPYLAGTRYWSVRGFPYLLIYREVDGEIEIVAVSHGRREPGYWANRLQ